jgi:hypothetical protein
MPAKDKEDFKIGHNEETFEYFTKLAKNHKTQVNKQTEELKNVDMNKIDITELHTIIKKNEK